MENRRRQLRPRRLLSVVLILVVATLIVVLRLVEEIGPERHPSDRFQVKRIVDGDTVELSGGDRLRLLAVDAPEKGEPYYSEAAQFLGRRVLGKRGVVEFAGRRRDGYGRLLGYLLIDTLFVNAAIIDSGMGYVYLFRDNDLGSPRIDRLLEAQRGAITRRSGLWSLEHEPEEFYVARVGSFRLHRPGCRAVQNLGPEELQVFQTREEALSTGLSPCRRCKP